MESGFGIWRLGEPSVWGLSLAALVHSLCLGPELNVAQLFKSMPFKSVIIIIMMMIISLAGGHMLLNSEHGVPPLPVDFSAYLVRWECEHV